MHSSRLLVNTKRRGANGGLTASSRLHHHQRNACQYTAKHHQREQSPGNDCIVHGHARVNIGEGRTRLVVGLRQTGGATYGGSCRETAENCHRNCHRTAYYGLVQHWTPGTGGAQKPG